VTPKRNQGARKGFTPIDDETSAFTYESPEQARHRGRQAFEQSHLNRERDRSVCTAYIHAGMEVW